MGTLFCLQQAKALTRDGCSNVCICGNDANGDGTLNATEYKDMVGDDTEVPTFKELDDNADQQIDESEIKDYPGCS